MALRIPPGISTLIVSDPLENQHKLSYSDYFKMYLSSGVETLIGIVVFKLVYLKAGEFGFSEYALIRRTASYIIPLLMAGQGIAIPRYISFVGAEARERHSSYLASASLICTALLFLFGIANYFFSSFFSRILFGTTDHSRLLLPLFAFLCASTAHALCYSFMRGRMLVSGMTILNIVNTGVLPILAVLFWGHSIINFILGMTVGVATISLGTSLIFLGSWRKIVELGHAFRDLLSYGLPRVLGDFGFAGLLGMPATVIVQKTDIIHAGLVSFAGTILSIIVLAVLPFSTLLLPISGEAFRLNRTLHLRLYIRRLLKIVICFSCIATIFILLMADKLILFLLGSEMVSRAWILRIIAFGCLPLSVFCCLRSVIDGVDKRPINAINSIISLAFFGVPALMYPNASLFLLLMLFVFSIYVLAILTIHSANRIINCE